MISKFLVSSLALIFGLLVIGGSAYAADHTVDMKSISFEPKLLEVKVGDTVEWKNVSYTEHSATGADFDTGMVQPKGTSKKISFKKAGDMTYICSVHGKTMTGHIVVKP